MAAGALAADPPQAAAAERLQGLWRALRGYDPPSRVEETDDGFLGRLFRRKPVDEAPIGPNGLYLVGNVGRGKSMLMDLFFAAADVTRKRRVHFHAFMQDAHARIHTWKRGNPGGEDPVPPLADALAAEAALLCFDEFQITDIADALILGRLFQALFARGVVVVATSNTLPDDLFKGRPGRDAFLPFIEVLKRHLDVLVLDGARDFRRARVRAMASWHVPADAWADAELDHAFEALTGGAPAATLTLRVMGRSLAVPMAAAGVARFNFVQLCGTALGPGDYLAIATHFQLLVLDRIPRLTAERRDEARRFITFVDMIYDHRVKLIASAAALPDELYIDGDGAEAFRRTASRLEEMQSAAWQALPHLP